MTIGADFAAKSLEIDGDKITANIWDLSGQMRFKIMRETYYRGVSGAIFVYDITRSQTLENLDNWVAEMRKNNNGIMVKALVIANKVDLMDLVENTVPVVEGMLFAKNLSERYNIDVMFVQASALTGENVETAFETLIHTLYDDFEKTL